MIIYDNATGFSAITQLLRQAVLVWRTRRAMAGMDRAMLSDIGLCAGAAEYEASKPFWNLGGRDVQ